MFLEIRGIKKSFGTGDSRVNVLKGLDLDIEKGEFCVLLGPSGSGKSTLLNIIGGIDGADSAVFSDVHKDQAYVTIHPHLTDDHSNMPLLQYSPVPSDSVSGYTSEKYIPDAFFYTVKVSSPSYPPDVRLQS